MPSQRKVRQPSLPLRLRTVLPSAISSVNTKVAVVSENTTLYVKGKTNILANVVSGSGITTYTSSNPKVAKVDANGKVTAVKKGSVIITATNNGVSGQVKITN